jgi:hypothetical protein
VLFNTPTTVGWVCEGDREGRDCVRETVAPLEVGHVDAEFVMADVETDERPGTFKDCVEEGNTMSPDGKDFGVGGVGGS